jgi:transcriptional regulator with XRE-family HTH domain
MRIALIDTPDDLGRALKDRRLVRRYPQGIVAEAAQLSRKGLGELEGSKVDAQLNTILRVANALGMRLALVPLEAVPYVEAFGSVWQPGEGRERDDQVLDLDALEFSDDA